MSYSDILKLPASEDTRLVIDLGGSTLRIMECDLQGRELEHERYLQPKERFASLDEGIATFLRALGRRPVLGVIGASGPIERGVRVNLTNIKEWPEFDAELAGGEFGMDLRLFNDLVVAAASVPALTSKDVEVIRDGTAEPEGPKLVAGIGTGLNDAIALPPSYGSMRFIAGESGHTPFAPRDETEAELLAWAWKRGDRYVSFEDVISGSRGFRLLFDFSVQHLSIAPLPKTVEALATDDPEGPIVTEAALTDGDEAAIRTLQLAGGIIGTYIALRAISTVATGGVYLVGGVVANDEQMRFMVEQSPLLQRLADDGLESGLVRKVPVYRVVHPEYGLVGASEIARHLGHSAR